MSVPVAPAQSPPTAPKRWTEPAQAAGRLNNQDGVKAGDLGVCPRCSGNGYTGMTGEDALHVCAACDGNGLVPILPKEAR